MFLFFHNGRAGVNIQYILRLPPDVADRQSQWSKWSITSMMNRFFRSWLYEQTQFNPVDYLTSLEYQVYSIGLTSSNTVGCTAQRSTYTQYASKSSYILHTYTLPPIIASISFRSREQKTGLAQSSSNAILPSATPLRDLERNPLVKLFTCIIITRPSLFLNQVVLTLVSVASRTQGALLL